jgi:rhodanese-related sulfurtransferase
VTGSRIASLLAQAREGLRRVEPEALADEVAAGAVLVDIRPEASRRAEGPMPGAVVIELTVLQWRVDPTSPDRLPGFDDPGLRIVVVCNEGYSSSLAAESLQRLGLRNATDLVGGYRAWRTQLDAHGFPGRRPPATAAGRS